MSYETIGDAGVSNVLTETITRLKNTGENPHAIPLGGTIAMSVGEDGKLIAGAPGAFGSIDLAAFNNRIIPYSSQDQLEEVPSPSSYHHNLRYAGLTGFTPLLGVGIDEYIQRSIQLKNSGVWPDMITDWPLPAGDYPAVSLANDLFASRAYATTLSEELFLGEYPNGVRLDSNEVYDNSAVWSAIVCAHIVPSILTFADKTSKEKGISLEQALMESMFLVPIGTDRQREVASFLDILAYYSGATFITVGANSSFGTPEGDAEQNLADTEKVAQLISKGILPRGYAYSVGDGLVMHGILKKMDPAARGLKNTVSAPDGYTYGGTFLSNHSWPIDKVEEQGCELTPKSPCDPSVIYGLGCVIPTDLSKENSRIHFISQNAADLTQAFNAVHKVDALNIPHRLPQGTQAVIIEGGGQGNVPAQSPEAIVSAATEQWARSDRRLKPTLIISSEAGIPAVGEDYSASPIHTLSHNNFIRGVINARGLPAHSLKQLAALHYYPKLVNINSGTSLDRSDEYIDPQELEKIIEDYGRSRQYPGF